VADLIVTATQTGRTVTVVTNNSRAAVTDCLAQQHLDSYVGKIVGRDDPDPALMKPSPYRVRIAVGSLQAEPEDCVFIGDTETGVLAGLLGGVAVIGYANKPGKAENLSRTGARTVVTDLAEITTALRDTPRISKLTAWYTRPRRRLTLGSVVPMSRILVTGMSGTGKSSALAELGRRGYRVVDTDDPGWREYREYVEFSDEVHRGEWLWVEERITGLLASDDGRSLFVQGCVRNQSKFYDRFNAVILLSAPADVILDRIARRTTNKYGKTPVERAMILDDLAKVEPLLRASCTHELDASRPLDEVVADLIAIASRPMTTS
jgi:shikimate kinase